MPGRLLEHAAIEELCSIDLPGSMKLHANSKSEAAVTGELLVGGVRVVAAKDGCAGRWAQGGL